MFQFCAFSWIFWICVLNFFSFLVFYGILIIHFTKINKSMNLIHKVWRTFFTNFLNIFYIFWNNALISFWKKRVTVYSLFLLYYINNVFFFSKVFCLFVLFRGVFLLHFWCFQFFKLHIQSFFHSDDIYLITIMVSQYHTFWKI